MAITALVAVVVLIWGINFLKASSLFDRSTVFYGIYDRVDGLKVSGSVEYRGYHVGQVSSIRFIGKKYDRVLVQFTVGKELKVPKDSKAVIQSTDLMGSKAINLVPGESEFYAESGDTLASAVELGLMEQVNKQVAPIKRKAEGLFSSLDTLMSSLQGVLNAETKGNIESSLKGVRNTLENVEHASGKLDQLITGQAERIASVIENLHSVTATLRNSNDHISQGLSNISEISDSLRAADLKAMLDKLDGILTEVDTVVRKINTGTGTLGEFVNNQELYYALESAGNNLDQLLADFQANPRKYIRFSVFDFGGSKNDKEYYSVVFYESEKPLPRSSGVFKKHPDLREVRDRDRFLYVAGEYKKLQQAERELMNVKEIFENAYIVKMPRNNN